MKKLLLTATFIFLTGVVYCQNFGNNDNPITFGLAGGSDFAFLQVRSAHRQDILTNAVNPFSLGFNIDYQINDYFSIKPGIFYAGKGGSLNPIYVDDAGNNVSVVDEYRLHYLEIPLDFVGHIPLGNGGNIFLGAGPYYAHGLNGTNHQTINLDPETVQKISFGKNGDFKSADFGATSVFGFQGESGWSISGNIDWGLTNIMQNNTTAFDATKLNTITFYIGIGQRF